MRHFIILILSVAVFDAHALSCMHQSTDAQVRAAQDIFVGEVIEITSTEKIETDFPWDAEQKILTVLRVIEVLRGNQRDTQVVDFSFDVRLGERYLIFNNSAFSSVCSFSLSTKWEEAKELLDLIRAQDSPELSATSDQPQ